MSECLCEINNCLEQLCFLVSMLIVDVTFEQCPYDTKQCFSFNKKKKTLFVNVIVI